MKLEDFAHLLNHSALPKNPSETTIIKPAQTDATGDINQTPNEVIRERRIKLAQLSHTG